MVPALVICGGFATYFLITGVRALMTGRMTVVNPDSRGSSPGPLGALLWRMRAPPAPDAQAGLHVEATGAEARGRAILHLALGAAFVAVAAATLVMR
jgi:hypothetical protein